jgi:hypothetical protein
MYGKNIQFFLAPERYKLLQLIKSKIPEFREEAVITVFQAFILCFEGPEGRDGVRHIGSPAGEAVKTVVHALPEPVIIEPVLGSHIGEELGKPGWEDGLASRHLVIGSQGEGFQAGGIGKPGEVVSQVMVIYNVDERSGIKSIVCLKKLFRFPCDGMGVGKSVDGPMEDDPMLNGFRVVQLLFPFHEVADEIAYSYVGYIEGEICMCQIIHSYNLLKSFLSRDFHGFEEANNRSYGFVRQAAVLCFY